MPGFYSDESFPNKDGAHSYVSAQCCYFSFSALCCYFTSFSQIFKSSMTIVLQLNADNGLLLSSLTFSWPCRIF